MSPQKKTKPHFLFRSVPQRNPFPGKTLPSRKYKILRKSRSNGMECNKLHFYLIHGIYSSDSYYYFTTHETQKLEFGTCNALKSQTLHLFIYTTGIGPGL